MCMDRNGHFVCECNPGYLLDIETNDCYDWNECNEELVEHQCPLHSECINKQASYECICEKGFQDKLDPLSGLTYCEDIDECTTLPAACDSGHDCVNNEGGYTCLCHNGYQQQALNVMCDDIDECATQLHECYDWAHR